MASLLLTCLSGVRNGVVILLKPNTFQGSERSAVFSALGIFSAFVSFSFQQCLTSVLKPSPAIPAFMALATPFRFPWLVSLLCLMWTDPRAQVWSVFSFLMCLTRG